VCGSLSLCSWFSFKKKSSYCLCICLCCVHPCHFCFFYCCCVCTLQFSLCLLTVHFHFAIHIFLYSICITFYILHFKVGQQFLPQFTTVLHQVNTNTLPCSFSFPYHPLHSVCSTQSSNFHCFAPLTHQISSPSHVPTAVTQLLHYQHTNSPSHNPHSTTQANIQFKPYTNLTSTRHTASSPNHHHSHCLASNHLAYPPVLHFYPTLLHNIHFHLFPAPDIINHSQYPTNTYIQTSHIKYPIHNSAFQPNQQLPAHLTKPGIHIHTLPIHLCPDTNHIIITLTACSPLPLPLPFPGLHKLHTQNTRHTNSYTILYQTTTFPYHSSPNIYTNHSHSNSLSKPLLSKPLLSILTSNSSTNNPFTALPYCLNFTHCPVLPSLPQLSTLPFTQHNPCTQLPILLADHLLRPAKLQHEHLVSITPQNPVCSIKAYSASAATSSSSLLPRLNNQQLPQHPLKLEHTILFFSSQLELAPLFLGTNILFKSNRSFESESPNCLLIHLFGIYFRN